MRTQYAAILYNLIRFPKLLYEQIMVSRMACNGKKEREKETMQKRESDQKSMWGRNWWWGGRKTYHCTHIDERK